MWLRDISKKEERYGKSNLSAMGKLFASYTNEYLDQYLNILQEE